MGRYTQTIGHLERSHDDNSLRRAMAARLDRAMQRANVSSAKAAKWVDVSEHDVQFWRRGITVPPLHAFNRIAKALDVDVHFASDIQSGALRLGRFHERPVGPHPQWSFQLAFTSDRVTPMLEWLAVHHGALDIFMHPNTGDDLRDHRDSAVWIGRSHELVLTVFQK